MPVISMAKPKPILTKHIDAILPFLEIFEKPGFKCGEWDQPESRESNEFIMLDYQYAPPVEEFVQALYDNDWVEKFDWKKWQDTAVQYVDSPNLLATSDAETIRKLLTTHVRKDRFCEGHVASMCENGHIVAVLRRLKEIRKEMKA
jgi:hypothetical protein